MAKGITAAQVAEAYQRVGTKRGAARELGIDPKAVRWHLRSKTWKPEDGLEVINEIPQGEPDESLINRRIEQFRLKQAKERELALRRIRVKMDGPIGILHFGDPHVDNDGTDLELLFRHANLTRTTEGLWGANIGDVTDNWVGNLARLCANTAMNKQEIRQLAMKFLTSVDWLYLVGGNHDFWTEGNGVLDWFAEQYGYQKSGRFQYHGVRVALQFPNGFECRINSRHDFKGSSEHHKGTHGGAKAARFLFRDHIFVAGHIHTCGYEQVSHCDPLEGDGENGLLSHVLRIGTYKKIDAFAKQIGASNGNYMPGAVTIIDPYAQREAAKVIVVTDPELGADQLTWMRKRWAKAK